MSNTFLQGLLIAGIGMGLVFLALILLWGLMAVMASIRFKSDQVKTEADEPAAELAEDTPTGADNSGSHALRMRAAAAAVAAALGLHTRPMRAVPPAPKDLSPWQVARRSGQFSQTNMVTNRKSRGSAR